MLSEHVAIASIHVATDFASDECSPAVSMGKIFNCPSDRIFDEPGPLVVKLSLEVLFNKSPK
jgi:hypothetical protein